MEIRGLHARVGEFELRDIDLKVDEGEYFILLGPTGEGRFTEGIYVDYPRKR